MPADYKRIHRLLKIYMLIQGDQGWTAQRLSEEFGVKPRTLFRDIEVLKKVGIPVHHDPERKCYQIRRDFYMPAVELTFEESLALISLGRYIYEKDQIPFGGPALKALAKIKGKLPALVRQELDLVEDHLAVKLAASAMQEGCDDCYAKIRRALAAHTCLRCIYESASHYGDPTNGKADPEPFLLKPYALFFNQRAWYVVGFHGGRGEVRTFKLNRFTMMEATKQSYSIPKGFTLEKHHGKAWRMIRGKTRYDVELIFDPSFAETIADTAWHDDQGIDPLPDGSLRFTCPVDGLDEIVWWVLSMGAHGKVVQPPELAQRVREEAAKMLALYVCDGAAAPAAPEESRVSPTKP